MYVCVCTRVCVCTLHFRRKPHRFHVYTYVCISYLPLAALFISLFMAILVFMVSFSTAFWLSLLYLCGLLVSAPARKPHMVSLPYVYVCLWNFLRLDLLLYGLLMFPLYSTEFVSVYCVSYVCRSVFFSLVFHIIFYQTYVVVIKLWLLSNCFYWLEEFTWISTKCSSLTSWCFPIES